MRKELREFLELWTVGFMIGSTQVVDMETTRKNDYGRILVAVLDPSLIPEGIDVVIGDHYFELDFEVEKWGINENGEEAEFEWNGSGMGSGGEGEERKGLHGEEEGQERMAKKQKMDLDSTGGGNGRATAIKSDSVGLASWKEQVQNMSEGEFEVFLRQKAGEILDKAAENVLDELVDKVMEEEEEGQQEAQVAGEMSRRENEEGLEKKLEEAAAVQGANKQQVRASPRLQRSKDEHVLAKAQGRAARKNLEFHGDNPRPISLLSVNRDKTLEYMQEIGVNFGSSSMDREDSFQALMNLELERDEVEGGGLGDTWLGSDGDSDEENIDSLEKML
jgi:hypothetical protein